MLSPHESLGIALIAFYVPIVPAAIRLMYRNVRIAGGPVTIALEQYSSPDHDYLLSGMGLYSAAILLLNVGAVPLIIATLGFVRIILLDNYTSPSRARILTGLMRGALAIAICLLVAGGAISSFDTPFEIYLSRTLTFVGYVVFAAMHVVLIAFMGFYWRRKKDTLLPSSRIVLRGGLLAAPFLIIRTVFGLLEVALQDSASSPFNPVTGNAVAFALMALLPEYVVVLAHLYTGFSIAPDRGVVAREGVEEEELETVTQEAAKNVLHFITLST
ncbi:uncharacterized protein TRIREDRAFT_111250 [Trichoderma reesei QM6a]|uniref:Predicted protein n=1 Tax=Hypocrea jecorina (strain QM6a) TaxID=431241 RepID=G0RTY1_HYPJQ|nr:uncharacterized protein TRIREDRAFT_111250 [Trichoderma reesei QM6a]EGR45355.1 predicted protein [Trichoderma reesei QM6a]